MDNLVDAMSVAQIRTKSKHFASVEDARIRAVTSLPKKQGRNAIAKNVKCFDNRAEFTPEETKGQPNHTNENILH